jgi:hypothetical protein
MPAFARVFHYAAAVISLACMPLEPPPVSAATPLRRHLLRWPFHFLPFSFFERHAAADEFSLSMPRHCFLLLRRYFQADASFFISFSPL